MIVRVEMKNGRVIVGRFVELVRCATIEGCWHAIVEGGAGNWSLHFDQIISMELLASKGGEA